MLRYKLLISRAIAPDNPSHLSLRELARRMGIPIPSMHNYVENNVLPRVDNIEKMAAYFREDVGSLFSEDDDLTAQLVGRVRALSDDQKAALLQFIPKKPSHTPSHTPKKEKAT